MRILDADCGYNGEISFIVNYNRKINRISDRMEKIKRIFK